MGVMLVDEKVISEAVETVKRLEKRWGNLFNAMEELLDEALTKAKEYSNPFSPANYGYWMGKASALKELKDRYDEICKSEVSNDSNT